MPGQGLRTVFLLTANEKIGHIDPAVHRTGRCLSALHFDPLDKEQSIEWLKSRDLVVPNRLPQESTIADLYAYGDGKALPDVGVRLGLGA